MEYSIGIPVKNEANTLEHCIDKALHQTHPPSQILVCVNGSTDTSLSLLQQIAQQELKVACLTSKPGKANAWRKIFDSSRENHILYTDADTILSENAGETLCELFEKSSDLIAAGGALVYTHPKQRNLFTTFYPFKHTVSPFIYFLSGRIYMLDKIKYENRTKELNTPLMPEGITNEDQYIDFIASTTQKGIKYTNHCFNLSQALETFEEWIKETKRVCEGQKQIRKEYPFLKKNSFRDLKSLTRTFLTMGGRFGEIESFQKKVGAVGFAMIRKSYRFLAGIKKGPKEGSVWKETLTTKKKFSEEDIHFYNFLNSQ